MKSVNSLIVNFFPLFRLNIVVFLAYYKGVLYAPFIYCLLDFIYTLMINKFFKLDPLTNNDRVFLLQNKQESYFISATFVFDKLNLEEFKESFYEKILRNFSRMRSIRIVKFFEHWWKDIGFEGAKKDLKFIENSEIVINTKEELLEYTTKELKKSFDIEKELPYRFVLLNNEKNKFGCILLLIFDHSLSDGIGIVSLVTALADNFDKDSFPRYRNPTYLDKLILKFTALLLLPFNLPIITYRTFFVFGKYNSPFKVESLSRESDCALSERYELKQYITLSKQLGTTFNDLCLLFISSALKNYINEHRPEFKTVPQISVIIPFSERPLPKKIEDLRICNDSGGVGTYIGLTNEIHKKEERKRVLKNIFQTVKNPNYLKTTTYLTEFMNVFLPYAPEIFKLISSTFDINFSNLPGVTKQLKFSGNDLKEIIPITTSGFTPVFLYLKTYNGNIRFGIAIDKNVKIDARLLLNYVEKEFQNAAKNLGNSETK